MRSEGDHNKEGMVAWDPNRYLASLSTDEVRYSRGFLRARPERWFPGFAAHWVPLASALGADLRVAEVRTAIIYPREFSYGFVATVDNEPVGVYLDGVSARNIVDAVAPGAQDAPWGVVLEYLARRFVSSLALSWSGPDPSVVHFEPESSPTAVEGVGAIRFSALVNGNPVNLWIVLGRFLVDKFDGLWRRQIQSSVRASDGQVDLSKSEVQIEIAQLAVPPSKLADYVRAGTAVDLEIPVTDTVQMRIRGKPWLQGRLVRIGGKLGVETGAPPPVVASVPEGSTRLSICLGSVLFDSNMMAEYSQPGAILDTGIPLGSRAVLLINNEKVANASLQVYEGRFAIAVLAG